MKILVVMDSISRAGGGLLDAERCLHRELAGNGIDTSVFALRDSFSEADLPSWAPLHPRFFPHRGPMALGASHGLRAAMHDESADLVYRAGLWRMPSKYAHDWSRKHGKPEIIAPHGMLDPWAVRNSRWKKRLAHHWFEGAHLRHASCVRTLCEAEAESIRAYGLKNPVCIIPNGIELVDAETLKTETLKGEKKILLFLGRLHPKKGLPSALRAWKQALHSSSNIQNSKFHDWQFVIAGWDQGGHEAELKRLCRELDLKWADIPAAEFVDGSSADQEHLAPMGTSGRARRSSPTVVFVGPAFGGAKDALLRRADAFILPSFSEGLPMSVLEAWSYRLPVLMTDHCNLPEGFAADAALCIGTDPESIAEGMRLLFRSPTSDLRSLGDSGRTLVERQFTWPQVAAQMKEVYEWVLGGGNVPDCVRQF
jgi:poly(glycerol-phosphate) alpha-glucosyltransferase